MKAFLGIDVSKGYADFSLLDVQKLHLENDFQLDDTRKGHDQLKERLARFIEKHRITGLYCAVESTGGFENNWYGSLAKWGGDMPVHVARVNPVGVKKNKEAGLSRNTTDALSSRYIAEYIISHPDAVRYGEQDINYSSYRSLHNHINLQKKQKTQLINQLKAVLYSSFPELIRYCKNSMPYWVLEVLVKYPTASRIASSKLKTLASIKHVGSDKARTLMDKAKRTVASRDNSATEYLVRSLAQQIKERQALIDKQKSFLEQACSGPEIDLLTSIVGIGAYSASGIMAEIERIERFPTPKHLASYFGSHPELRESGDKKFVSHISKKGRASMRGILFMCANSAVISDPHLKKIYHGHRSKGMGHKQAIGVIMHKMLRIVWGVLTTGTKYDPAVDQQNIEKAQQGRQIEIREAKQTGKRRFQGHDEDAPVSNKQSKARRVLKGSKVPETESSTGSPFNTLLQT